MDLLLIGNHEGFDLQCSLHLVDLIFGIILDLTKNLAGNFA